MSDYYERLPEDRETERELRRLQRQKMMRIRKKGMKRKEDENGRTDKKGQRH